MLVTLLSVFEQCRAFSDGTETEGAKNEIKNMVRFPDLGYKCDVDES